MPPNITYRCTICGTEHLATNGWFVYFVSAGFEIMKWHDAEREGYLNDDRARYACGAAHAVAAFNRYLMDAVCATPPATPDHLPDSAAPDPEGPSSLTTDCRPAPSTECHSTSSGSQLPAAPGDRPTPEEPRESPHPEACLDGRRGYESDVTECPDTGLAGIV